MMRAKSAIAAIAVAVGVLAVACEDPTTPTAPDTRPAALTIESIAASATQSAAGRPFTYQVSLVLRETAGVGGAISEVTATLREASGATTETQFSAIEALGMTRFLPAGALTATGISVAGSLSASLEITVRMSFIDDHLNAGSVQASLGVNADFSGEWIGPSTITQPPGDWSFLRVFLVQRDSTLSGELLTRDGRRFPLSGSLPRDGAPGFSVGGLPTGSAGCRIGFVFREFAFSGGQMRRMLGPLTGRCPGTASGTADLQRSS